MDSLWPEIVPKKPSAGELEMYRKGAERFLNDPSVQFIANEFRKTLLAAILHAKDPDEEHTAVERLRIFEDLARRLYMVTQR